MYLFIRKKTYTIMDRYDVIDDASRLVLTADGKLTRLRGYLVMRDRAGQELLRIFKSPNLLYANYSITANGKPYASMVQKLTVKPAFEVKSDDGDYKILGNIDADKFELWYGKDQYGMIKRKYLRWGDCYALEFSNTQYADFYCSLVIAIDNAMNHNI